jgi:hypothetical protein
MHDPQGRTRLRVSAATGRRGRDARRVGGLRGRGSRQGGQRVRFRASEQFLSYLSRCAHRQSSGERCASHDKAADTSAGGLR